MLTIEARIILSQFKTYLQNNWDTQEGADHDEHHFVYAEMSQIAQNLKVFVEVSEFTSITGFVVREENKPYRSHFPNDNNHKGTDTLKKSN